MKYVRGEPVYVKIEIDHDAGGKFEISCDCGKCFATTVKALKMTYAIKK